MGKVLAVGNQPLMQVAGEQGEAVGTRVVAEEMAGHAYLAAAAGAQHGLIQLGQSSISPSREGCRRERWTGTMATTASVHLY